jgi:hypothetical protein
VYFICSIPCWNIQTDLTVKASISSIQMRVGPVPAEKVLRFDRTAAPFISGMKVVPHDFTKTRLKIVPFQGNCNR